MKLTRGAMYLGHRRISALGKEDFCSKKLLDFSGTRQVLVDTSPGLVCTIDCPVV